ncbi:hypothetical protein MHLP_02945 [Candidatus Mycoplasma haematolamae str. Purdue]|uniref:Uncharacterized protein n=1 Tax=Mycoplasma haematolamae (strain Purdue) TaxID=1212765 RepID=I7CJW6_MYCHA|nr:hypothetical protein [Candidatus Mycoplasma haematolamae]AFO52169.1 hypothetical protein MHLP_02945 [Candidatus Mycoplasma haematolamae str. Purdue]
MISAWAVKFGVGSLVLGCTAGSVSYVSLSSGGGGNNHDRALTQVSSEASLPEAKEILSTNDLGQAVSYNINVFNKGTAQTIAFWCKESGSYAGFQIRSNGVNTQYWINCAFSRASFKNRWVQNLGNKAVNISCQRVDGEPGQRRISCDVRGTDIIYKKADSSAGWDVIEVS